MPDLVLAANREADGLFDVEGAQSAAETFESYDGFVILDIQRFKFGATKGNLDAVVVRQCPTDEAGGDVVFVFRVNVFTFSEVSNDRLAGVWQRHRLCLRLAEFCPIALGWRLHLRFEIRQLDPIEREVALIPFFAPLLNHEGKES